MNMDARSLVQRIVDDPSLRETLWRALVADTNFIRQFVDQINEGIEGGHITITLGLSAPRRPEPKPKAPKLKPQDRPRTYRDVVGKLPRKERPEPDYV